MSSVFIYLGLLISVKFSIYFPHFYLGLSKNTAYPQLDLGSADTGQALRDAGAIIVEKFNLVVILHERYRIWLDPANFAPKKPGNFSLLYPAKN